MVKNIDVDTFLEFLGEGVSKPALILGSDSNRYIMKKQRVKQEGETLIHDCMFLNEIFAYQIAHYLDVPITEAAIAHLDSKLIEYDPAITFVHKFQEGIHFASLELENKEENLMDNYAEALRMGKPYTIRSWRSFFDNINNKDDISKIIAFDLLIGNFDRYGNTGNLLISNDGISKKVFAIDHGHAFFGPIWNTGKINALRSSTNSVQYINWIIDLILTNNLKNGEANGMGEVFRNIETSIDLTDVSNHSFQDTVQKIESISEDQIDSWLDIIPDSWYVEKQNQIAFYKQFILKQTELIRILLQNMAERRAFSNYRGGVLEWRNARQVGTV